MLVEWTDAKSKNLFCISRNSAWRQTVEARMFIEDGSGSTPHKRAKFLHALITLGVLEMCV